MYSSIFLNMNTNELQDDEWLFESVKCYDSLHMYELQHPAPAVEWLDDNVIVVGCWQSPAVTDLLYLQVPESFSVKLHKETTNKRRDFRILGGFQTVANVTGITSLHQTKSSASVLMTSRSGVNSLTLWAVPTDLAESTKQIAELKNTAVDSYDAKCCVLIQPNSASADLLVHGSRLNNLSLVDLTTLQCVQNIALTSLEGDLLSNLVAIDDHSFVACSLHSGTAHVIDSRQSDRSAACVTCHTSVTSDRWTCDVERNSGTLMCLSSSGHLVCHDIKYPDRSLPAVRRLLPHRNTCSQFLKLQCDVAYLSVSGYDGNVYLYDTQKIVAANKPTPAQGEGEGHEPVFTHKGHVAETAAEDASSITTTTHLRHPHYRRYLLSTASDSSLHLWQCAATG